jgi:hypothetical protein
VKPPTLRRAAIAALLLAPVLTACGFSAQTDQVYQAAVGPNFRGGEVDILDALIVSGQDGSGTFAGTLVNTNQSNDDRLDSVTGPGITASRRTIVIPAGGTPDPSLAHSGELTLRGDAIKPGAYVELTFAFSNGQSTTLQVPVVENTGDFIDVPVPALTNPTAE